jgi:hypothetical protein
MHREVRVSVKQLMLVTQESNLASSISEPELLSIVLCGHLNQVDEAGCGQKTSGRRVFQPSISDIQWGLFLFGFKNNDQANYPYSFNNCKGLYLLACFLNFLLVYSHCSGGFIVTIPNRLVMYIG